MTGRELLRKLQSLESDQLDQNIELQDQLDGGSNWDVLDCIFEDDFVVIKYQA